MVWKLQYDKGKIEGMKEGKIEVARKMLQKGMAIDDVVDITGFSLKEVEDVATRKRATISCI